MWNETQSLARKRATLRVSQGNDYLKTEQVKGTYVSSHLHAQSTSEPLYLAPASVHTLHGRKTEEEKNTHMEISAHKLNLTPILSLTVLRDVLCFPEKEQIVFKGWVVLLHPHPPPLGRSSWEVSLSHTHCLEARSLTYSSLNQMFSFIKWQWLCQGEKSPFKQWCETCFWLDARLDAGPACRDFLFVGFEVRADV